MITNPTRTLTLAAALLISTGASADTLLFAGPAGTVHALDTGTGDVTFQGTCAGPVASMAVHDGTLYLGDANGVIYAYDVLTNQVNDAFVLSNNDANAMTWLGNQLVVADSSGRIDYYNTTTQQVDTSVLISDTDITTIGIDAGGLFIGGESSLAVRAHIGQENFEFFAACGSQIQSMAFGADTMYLSGIAFGGAQSGTVYLFDKFEGGVNYTGTFPVDSDATATVAIDNMLYIAGSDGVIHEMDTQTGTIARTFDTGIEIQAMTPQQGLASCPADYDANGQLNFNDVSRFINLFNNQIVPGDTNGDGAFDFYDISQFITIYTSGC
jgi:hypothetical protein